MRTARTTSAAALGAALLLPVAALAAPAGSAPASDGPGATAVASLVDAGGGAVGTATFATGPDGVVVTVEAAGLAPGLHGTHVHERGECAPGPDATTGEIIPFGAAGGHLDPETTRNHDRPEVPATVGHAGDLPNLEVGADGRGTLTFTTPDLVDDEGGLAVIGRSIVIHGGEDDHATDPAGASGPRVACGVVIAQPTAITDRFVLPGGYTYPEGIATDLDAGVAYVGSSSTGTIFRIDLATGASRVFALGGSPGRTAALGMALDGHGRLLVAGGATGRLAVLDTATAGPVATLDTPPSPQTFLNDVVVAGGYAYVTDSLRPVLFRAAVGVGGIGPLEPWLDLTTTPIAYGPGFNLNGIAASADGRHLVTVQSNTGQLWRIRTADRTVRPVDTGGVTFPGGDGLLAWQDVLWVVRNSAGTLVRLDVAPAFRRGEVVQEVADPNLMFPTTAAWVGDRLLVVNGQLDTRATESPVLPFVVTAVDVGARPTS